MLGLGYGRSYRQVYSDETLTDAWRKVRTNSAAAGVDQVTPQQFQARLFLNLKTLQRDLKKRRYYPQPVKRIYIPKSDGTRRPLGILTVRDRIVQRALLRVIEPLFEAGFEEVSYAFRQGRSIQMAVSHAVRLVNQGYGWVVDMDIASFFETVNTEMLYRFIRTKVKDGELRRLIRAYLRQETVRVERNGIRRKEQPRGILQGGILSPLFANVYLDKFDKMALRRGLKIVRYADDILIFCKNRPEAEKALKTASKSLGKLGLEVNAQKTRIAHAAKGMRFLGEDLLFKRSGGHGRLVPVSRTRQTKAEQPLSLPAEPVHALTSRSDDGDPLRY